MNRDLSKDGAAFIKHWEGCSLQMYLCSNGKATIGYGHRVYPDQLEAYRDGIDMNTALRLFRADIAHAIKLVDYCTQDLNISQAQFDMLVSFVFNVGETAFRQSTLLRELKQRHFGVISAQMRRWVHDDHGRSIKGLVNRRRAEGQIFDGKLSIEKFLNMGSNSAQFSDDYKKNMTTGK